MKAPASVNPQGTLGGGCEGLGGPWGRALMRWGRSGVRRRRIEYILEKRRFGDGLEALEIGEWRERREWLQLFIYTNGSRQNFDLLFEFTYP